MKKRIPLYVKGSPLILGMMAICMIASGVARIVLFAGKGVWTGVVLPVAAVVLYALIGGLSGKERFYKSAIPVWLLGLCYGVQFYQVLKDSLLLYISACVCIVIFCALYTAVVSGWAGKPWVLLSLYLLALAGLVAVCMTGGWSWIPEVLMVAGMILLLCAVKVRNDDKYHPTWGDRIEGRRIRTASTMEQIGAYFMPNRNGANNMFSEAVEISEVEKYIRRKRREGLAGFGLTHVIMAAYVRTVAKYPALNRFIAGQKIYTRGEDIALCMTVKKEMTAEAPDSLVKVHLHPADTAIDVYHKFAAQVEAAKDEMENTNADNTVDAFMLIPGLVLKFVVWLLKTLDYFGMVPAFLLEVSPFHGSIYFTSMGSLGIKPVYHHLYDFGTVPAFCAFGRKRREHEIVNGELVERKYVDLKFNLDERICDGFYYANVIKYFLRVMSHPDVLDNPPEKVEEDIA